MQRLPERSCDAVLNASAAPCAIDARIASASTPASATTTIAASYTSSRRWRLASHSCLSIAASWWRPAIHAASAAASPPRRPRGGNWSSTPAKRRYRTSRRDSMCSCGRFRPTRRVPRRRRPRAYGQLTAARFGPRRNHANTKHASPSMKQAMPCLMWRAETPFSCPNSDGPGNDLGGTVKYMTARPMKTTPSTTAPVESNLLEFILRIYGASGHLGTPWIPRLSRISSVGDGRREHRIGRAPAACVAETVDRPCL
jgi:hypothetical protein